MIEKPLSYLVNHLLPDYIADQYPQYVLFIKRYFEMMEAEGGPSEVVNNLTKLVDVSRIPDDEIYNLIQHYLNSFPIDSFENINISNFIQNSKDFYSKKGTESSLKFIFNLLSGSLEVYYPSNDIFVLNLSVLSGTHKIHDNEYYAYYVYEIRSDQDIDKYSEIVESLIHPIGTKSFYVKVDFDDWLKFNYTEATQYIPLF